MYLCSCDIYGGKPFRWPAQGADGYACDLSAKNTYGGTDTDFVMGTLLAIPPGVAEADLNLRTPEAKKIFAALRDYGAYVSEDAGQGDNFQIMTEAGVKVNGRSNWAEDDGYGFYNDINTIIPHLHIVTNQDENTIGGGPNAEVGPAYRRGPVAAACAGCSVTYDPPRIIEPDSGVELLMGATITLTGEGEGLSWSYDANSDGEGAVAIGSGAEVQFAVPTGVGAPYRITIMLSGSGGTAERTDALVQNATELRPVRGPPRGNAHHGLAARLFTIDGRLVGPDVFIGSCAAGERAPRPGVYIVETALGLRRVRID